MVEYRMALLHRNLASAVAASLGDSPVVFLQGARQTGKSTLVRELIEGTPARYVTLDDAAALAAAQAAGDRFIRGIVLCTVESAVPFGKDLLALPVSTLWE